MIMKELKKWKRSYIALTAVVLVLGICLIIWPGISAGVLCCLFGAVLVVVGAVRIFCYFQRGISVLWHRYELPLGLLDALLGVYFFTRPANVLLILPVVAGIMIIVDSVFKLQTALELREIGARRWWWVLAFSVISILAALLLIGNPFEGAVALMIYLGVSLVIDGVQSLFFIHQVAKNVRELTPLDAEYVVEEP